jgi:hypothetical protein
MNFLDCSTAYAKSDITVWKNDKNDKKDQKHTPEPF